MAALEDKELVKRLLTKLPSRQLRLPVFYSF